MSCGPLRRGQAPQLWPGALALCVWLWPLQAAAQSGEELNRWFELNVCAAAATSSLVYAGLGFWACPAARLRILAALGQVTMAISITLCVLVVRSPGSAWPWIGSLLVLSSAGFAWTLRMAARPVALGAFLIAGWWLVPVVAWFPGFFLFMPWLTPFM